MCAEAPERQSSLTTSCLIPSTWLKITYQHEVQNLYLNFSPTLPNPTEKLHLSRCLTCSGIHLSGPRYTTSVTGASTSLDRKRRRYHPHHRQMTSLQRFPLTLSLA